ncbi:hypothetical protein BGX33_000127 [Mortierella sp. NVP41]|nr:hypothetical protein BGX33_000127 [Mortierella sp. NVP41]
MQTPHPPVQAIRSVLRNSRNIPTTPDPADVFHVDIYTDPDTKKQFVLWDDIRLAFDDAPHVRHLSRVVPFVKGDDLIPLKPHRIAAVSEVVLDVVVSGQFTQAEIPQSLPPRSRFEQIAQQATRFPKHDPLTTLRHRHSTPNQSYLNRPSITLVPRSPAVDTSLRHRSKELTQQTVKEIMKKIAAHVDLDSLHAKGDGPSKDFPKALECYLKIFHQGHALALISVGDLFLEGQDVSQDPSLAMAWYFKTACQGDTNAQRKFEALRLTESRRATLAPTASLKAVEDGQLADTKQLSTEDTPQGTRPKSCQEDNKSEAGKNLTDTTFVHRPEETAMDNYAHTDNPTIISASSAPHIFSTDNKQHKSDTPEPQHSGNKTQLQAQQKDTVPATKIFASKMATANLGDKDAQVAPGDIYRDGVGVRKDYQAAMDWYLKAAYQGHVGAQLNIGLLITNGQDYSQAMDWYRKAADQGHVIAQSSIGSLYKNGEGVPQDYSQAMNWYRKAADQGDVKSQFNIGILYELGRGVPQDYSQAMDWYRKAADQGHGKAQFSIGSLYEHVRGVPRNYSLAMD